MTSFIGAIDQSRPSEEGTMSYNMNLGNLLASNSISTDENTIRGWENDKVLPATRSIAYKLAARMLQPGSDVNIDKISKLFTKNSQFTTHVIGLYLNEYKTKMNIKEFINAINVGHKENVEAIVNCTNTFEPLEDDNTGIKWVTKSTQYRLGKGMLEKEPGWYRIEQAIHLKFAKENGETKISEWYSPYYKKTKIDTPSVDNIPSLSPAAHARRHFAELAVRATDPQLSPVQVAEAVRAIEPQLATLEIQATGRTVTQI